ncbi:outer membrane beta-barrel protein [Hoeflea ulvae]|uniref:Outer membrane beta-barrel protein n=1 Tax=Hoeflea ulvae TaxID=2983764 RepID=A0ABT3YKX5_9HYPH|nr:outer membrane beta-barrel protein [Hoeflea ulvae]MCY0096559.1 outer membrane beta-barrel protein [Hoeflea ulvae]
MRNPSDKIQTKATALRAGYRLGVSAACLLSALAAAQAQSVNGSSTLPETYDLRGTTTQASTPQSRAAATLYGALPTSRDDQASLPGIEEAIGTTQADAPTQQTDTAQPQDQTGSIAPPTQLSQADQDFADSLGAQNARIGTVDGLPEAEQPDPSAVPGFMLGTLTLRPTIDQKIVRETVSFGADKTSRTYSETTVSGTLQSDWSRHQLAIDGSASWEENISGTGTESPEADLDARLNLDLANDLTAIIGAGYSYSQESSTDANAIAGAATQSGIHDLRASVGLQRDLGLLRGTTTLEMTRTLYGDVTLPDGGTVAVNDRDTVGAELTTRIGYALSPALIPFLEASVGREKYDQRIDSTGAERSSNTYGVRAGAEIDMGEKLSGELAAGYLLRELDDASLNDISGLTLDGTLTWSPLRGTSVLLGVATTVEAATAAGESGAIVYQLNSGLTQQIHSAVVARLGGTAEFTNYTAGGGRGDERIYGASAGLTWSINRYLDLEAEASYELTRNPGIPDEKTTRIGLGLKLRR